MMDRVTKKCGKRAAFRYTWPGRDEYFVCLEHSFRLKSISIALGSNLQLIPLSIAEQSQYYCSQEYREAVLSENKTDLGS